MSTQSFLNTSIALVISCFISGWVYADMNILQCPKDQTCILVVKPARHPLIGSFPVYNEKFVPIGELSGKSYVRWVTDPGEHTIRVFSRNKPEITDIFEAGEIYYFLLEVPVISNSLVLRSISADVASKYIVGCADKTLISAFLGRLQEQ